MPQRVVVVVVAVVVAVANPFLPTLFSAFCRAARTGNLQLHTGDLLRTGRHI